MKETVKLSLENLKKKPRIAYASIVSNIKHIDKLNLAKIYNSLVVPHLLSLCPVWQFFSEPQKLSVRRVYFRYAKFLLSYPPWTRNSYLMNKFRLVSPTSIIDKRLRDFRSSMSIVSHTMVSITYLIVCVDLYLFVTFFSSYYSILRAFRPQFCRWVINKLIEIKRINVEE